MSVVESCILVRHVLLMIIFAMIGSVFNCWFSIFLRGNLEGKREKRNYRALVEDPQLQFSGLYQRFVMILIV